MSDAQFFVAEVESARHRLETLVARTRGDDVRSLLSDALELLGDTIEELHVAGEELASQNRELIGTRIDVEAERERYRRLFEFAPDAYLVTDAAGVIQEANRAAIAILGMDAKCLVGKPLVVFISPRDRPAYFDLLQRLAASDTVIGGQLLLLPRGGAPMASAVTAVAERRGGALQGMRWQLHNIDKQKRAAHEREHLLDLLASERARLHAVIAHAPEGILVTDAQGRVMLANRVAQDLGFQAGTHSDDQDTQAPDRWPAGHALPLVRAVSEGEVLRDVGLTATRADGEERDLLVSVAPIRDGEGQISGGVAVLQDVTEWKATQEALRRYAERLQILHEMDEAVLGSHSVDAIATAALQHVWQFVPCCWAGIAMFEEQMGEITLLAARADRATPLDAGWRGPVEWAWFVPELAQGQSHVIEDLTSQSSSSPVIGALRDLGVRTLINVPLAVNGRLIGSLNLGMSAPGHLQPEHLEIVQEMGRQVAIAIHQAELNAQVARHTQQLERRVVERTAALRASEARLRTIFEASAVGIAVLDLQGHIRDSNPALQAMFGLGADVLCDMVFTDLLTAADPDEEGDMFSALLAGRCDSYRAEGSYRRRGGGIGWANLALSLVRRAGGVPWFAIAMVDDVTEHRAMQAALVEAEKLTLTGRLVASLTHEINNPLQAVIGCLGLAQEALDAGQDPNRYLAVARDELRRTAGIVGHLRELYRPADVGQREPVDVNALIHDVLDLNRKQIAGRGIALALELDEVPRVPAIADRIRQVLLNLMLNALDAMPDGGRLQVVTSATDGPEGVRVTVRDSGVGIPPDILPRIFDSFYSTKPDGLGLGLFITRGIVLEHGGNITASSTPGEGTTFDVWLPAKAATHQFDHPTA